MTQTLTEHRFAAIFPLMEGDDFDRLVADIRANGQAEPITVMNGMILDGRNRYRACQEIGIEPDTLEYDGDDALAFVLSLNLHRRHLTESQRAMVAERIESFRHGGARLNDQEVNSPLDGAAPTALVSRSDAAKMLNVSAFSVKQAAVVQRHGIPELAQAVDAGRVAVSAAARVARLPHAEQRAVVAAGDKAIVAKSSEMHANRQRRDSPRGPRTVSTSPQAASSPEPAEPEAEPAPEPASNVVQLGARLNVMPTEGQIERDAIAEEGAAEYRAAEDFDQTKVEHRARAINGALNTFDHVRCTGRDYWQVYGKNPARDTFIAWVRAAKSTIDDILKEYENEYDGVRKAAGNTPAKPVPAKADGRT